MDCLGDWHFTPGWGSLITASIATLAILVSTYWNRRTLQASDKRSREERRERALERKRLAVADVLTAAAIYIDGISLVRMRIKGVINTEAEKPELIDKMHATMTDHYIPTKRALETKISVAQLVIDESGLLSALVDIRKLIKADAFKEHEDFDYDDEADESQAQLQEKIRKSVVVLQAEALRLFRTG